MSINCLFRTLWTRCQAAGLSFVLIMSCWLAIALPAQAQGAPPEVTNGSAEPVRQVRIWPTNNTTLITDQRFDLRVESLVPARTTPKLQSISINGQNFTNTFKQGIQHQLNLPGGAIEVGQPTADSNLFGQTLRNYTFDRPGTYQVVATLNVDGQQVIPI